MKKRANLMFACTIGGTLEWYDFFVFASCAVLVFPKQFFVVDNPFLSTLLSLATFSVAFIARPVGGVIFGVIGDRVGRRKTLIISLLLMGLSTFCVGLLPTYHSIGVAAPIALVTLRIIQGFAVSGETAGSILMIAESMPYKQRGFWSSFALAAGPLAILFSSLVMGLVQKNVGSSAFIEWAWRIPFLLSGVLVLIGYWTRRSVEESIEFTQLAASRKTVERAVLSETLRGHWQQMVRAFFLKIAENTFIYLFSTFLLAFATGYLKFDRAHALTAVTWASGIEVAMILLAAYLSDRFGRRPVILIGLVSASVMGCVLFSLPPGTEYALLQVVLIACLVSHGIILGPMAAYLAELFPTRVRYTALSTSYQLASVLGGAIAPIVAMVLIRYTGMSISVAVYAAASALPAFIVVFFSRESRGSQFLVDEAAGVSGKTHDDRPALSSRSA